MTQTHIQSLIKSLEAASETLIGGRDIATLEDSVRKTIYTTFATIADLKIENQRLNELKGEC